MKNETDKVIESLICQEPSITTESKSEEEKRKEQVKETLIKGWPIITSIVAIISAIIINSLVYLQQRAYFDFWKIPREYIRLESRNTLFESFVWLIITFGIILLCNIVWFLIKEYAKKKKLCFAILSFIFFFGVACVLFVVAWRDSGFGWNEIWMGIRYETKALLGKALLFEVLLMLLFVACIYCFHVILDLVSQIKKIKEWDIRKMGYMCMVLVVAYVFICIILYSESKYTYANDNKLEIVTIEDRKYIVLAKVDEEWIIKECGIENEKDIYVSEEEYCIASISSYTIRSHVNSMNNRECLLQSTLFHEKFDRNEEAAGN